MKILVLIVFFMSELLFALTAKPIRSDIKSKVSGKWAATKANVTSKSSEKVENIARNRITQVFEGDANPKSLGKPMKIIKKL